MADPTSSGTNRNANQGTGFTNYSDILNANQGAGERMGNAIGQGLQSQANSVQGQLGQQQQDFNTGYGTQDQNWQGVSGIAKQLDTAGGYNNDATNPALNTGATTDVNAIKAISDANGGDLTNAGNNFRNFTYTGPTGLANTAGLNASAATASALGQFAGNTSGQQQLLNNYVGGGNYTQGQNAFDQALLSKYGQAPINQAKKSLSGINTQIQGAENQATNKALGEQQNIKALQSNTGYGTGIGNALGNEGIYVPGTGLTGTNNGGYGLLGTATTQAGQWTQGAGQIEDILSKAISNPAQLQADIASGKVDPSIVNNLKNYGFDPTTQVYNKSGSAYNQGQLSNLLSLYNKPNLIPQGVQQQYTGNQQAAATALAQFLGNTGKLSEITGNTFDTQAANAFNPASNNATAYNTAIGAVGQGGTEQNTDVQAQKDIQNYVNTVGKLNIQPLTGDETGWYSYGGEPAYNAAQPINQYLNPGNAQYAEYLNPNYGANYGPGAYNDAGYMGYKTNTGGGPFINPKQIAGNSESLQALLSGYVKPKIAPPNTGPGKELT